MDEAERQARIARFMAEHEQWVREENERTERQAAIDGCDACPEVKAERDETRDLPNGLRMRMFYGCCAAPGMNCTALVQSHFTSESPDTANRIVERLVSQPELAALGVTYMACLAIGADRLILTCRVPAIERVVEFASAVSVEEFREPS